MTNSAQLASQTDDDLDEEVIEDESEKDDSALHATYDITSFGIDFDVEGLVRRLNNGDVNIPDWQRRFIWNINDASSFVESLLLGLPVPGVFMGVYSGTNRLYVIDGQQRLRTIQGFYEGKFPKDNRKFELKGVDGRFINLTYNDLKSMDRRQLDNSLIHATVVRQDYPKDNDTSMYEIFRRLNSGGRPVNPQEIRCAVYQGKLIDMINELNENPEWRSIVGKPNPRLKDQEMILRFMAMLYKGDKYVSPMSEFLNIFTQTYRNPDCEWMIDAAQIFKQTVKSFADAKGRKAFRTSGGRVVNAAIFDSMSVGLASKIRDTGAPVSRVGKVHDDLIANEKYFQAIEQGTSSERSVRTRLGMAKAAFANA